MVMSRTSSPTDVLAQIEAELIADLAKAESDAARIRVRLAQVRHGLGRDAESLPEPASKKESSASKNKSELAEPSIGNLQLIDAAVEHLKKFDKAVSTGMVCAELERAGYNFGSANPVRALSEALKKRAVRYGDVINVGHGLWVFRDSITREKLNRIMKRHGGTGGRSSEAHGDLTSQKMKIAQENGVRVGAALMFSRDQATEFKQMLESGTKSRIICEKMGISRPTFYNYKKRLSTWKIGDPYPPSQSRALIGHESDRVVPFQKAAK